MLIARGRQLRKVYKVHYESEEQKCIRARPLPQATKPIVRAGRGMFDLATRRPSGIDAHVQRINQETRQRPHDLLRTVPPARFEALITELLLQMGFDEQTVKVTPYSKDGGIDVEGVYRAAGLTEMNAAVQVKRWKQNVQAPTVTQLRGSLQVHQQGIIITTSDFSPGARKEAAAANKTRIGLINGQELLNLLVKHGVGVEEKTLKVVSLDDEWWGELLAPVLEVSTPNALTAPKQPMPTPATQQSSTNSKPQAVALFGQICPVATWKALLLQVCTILLTRHGDTFVSLALTLRGRKRNYFAVDSTGMISPAPIPGAELWVETNLSARSIRAFCERLLAEFGHEATDLQIITQPSASNNEQT
jgi:restriction system protein